MRFHIYMWFYIYVCVWLYICILAYSWFIVLCQFLLHSIVTQPYICIHIYVCVCVCVCIYVCIYMCVCVCVCVCSFSIQYFWFSIMLGQGGRWQFQKLPLGHDCFYLTSQGLSVGWLLWLPICLSQLYFWRWGTTSWWSEALVDTLWAGC